jgi:hypothetical protein
MTFAAPLIRTTITRLQADLDDAIAAFNAQPENTVDLVMPVQFAFGAADPLILVAGPVVEVSVPSGTSGDYDIGNSEFDHDLRLNVCVWHEGDRGELPTTYEMSLGLARCIVEVLTQDAAMGAEVDIAGQNGWRWRADVIPEDPSDDGREFRKWRVPVLVEFTLETVERFQA